MSRIEYYVMDLIETKKELSDRIQDLRKAAGYSSAASFAAAIDITPAKYTHYEQNKTSMPLEVAMRIASRLGVSLDELAYGEEPSSEDETMAARIAKLDGEGKRELEQMLRYVEFRSNLRRYEPTIEQITKEEFEEALKEAESE